MTPKVPAKRRGRIGRPPAGARAGERVKDYPQLSVRLPDEVKARLNPLLTLVRTYADRLALLYIHHERKNGDGADDGRTVLGSDR